MTYNERHILTLQKEFTELGYAPNTIMRYGATYSIRSGQVTFDTWDRTVTPVLVAVNCVPLTSFNKYAIPDVLRWVEVVE